MNLPRVTTLFSLLLAATTLPLSAGENFFKNPGFENGDEGWRVAVPTNFSDKEVAITVCPEAAKSGGNGLAMSSAECIRYAAIGGVQKTLYPLIPGERFCVSAWVRAGNDFTQRPNTVGFCIRVTTGTQRDGPGDPPIYFGFENHAARGNSWQRDIEVPKTWTKISSVFEIPQNQETKFVDITFQVAEASGTIYLDDVSLERVPETTPLTPLFSK